MMTPRPDPDFENNFSDYNNPEDFEFIDDEEFIEPDFEPSDISRVHSDIELESVIKELLHNSRKIDARDVTVTVDNCNVKLSGTVHSQEERDYALTITKLIHGVGEVENQLIVKLNDGILPTDIGRNP